MNDCTATISSSTWITTKRYYYHTNHLGSVIALTNGTWDVVQSYAYDSFGKVYVVSWSGVLASVDDVSNLYGNTRLFTWREYDTETSLYFHRARYYHPQTGRFTSRDPIWQNDQINLYTYVGNSPLNYIDPTGEFLETVWDVGNIAYDVGRWVKNIGELSWDGMVYAYWSITDDTCLKKQAVVSAKENFSDLWEVAIDAWTDAAAAMIPFVPAGTTKVVRMGAKIEKKLKWAANPKVKEAAAKWRQMHKEYNPFNNPETKEFTIPDYWRADAVDVKNFVVRELKPNNPSAKIKWENQLQRYIEWLEKMIPESKWLWKSFLDTYN